MKKLLPARWRAALGKACAGWKRQRGQSKFPTSLRGDAVECNICGWRGGRFADNLWHERTRCPACHSLVRHRMLAALLDGHAPRPGWDEASLFAGKEVLHFAPEERLRERVKRAAGRYVTADLDRPDCDLCLDMSSMPSVPQGSFDVVVACDVLEHVPDDRAAMRELHRVLRPGGKALLTVPQKDPPAATDEDPSVQGEAERTRRFAQKDHVRMYGDDFAARLHEAGFAVDILGADQFPQSVVQRHVLAPPVLSVQPLATNFRRLYLATR